MIPVPVLEYILDAMMQAIIGFGTIFVLPVVFLFVCVSVGEFFKRFGKRRR